MSSRPAPIMEPQETTLGSPRPMKESAASIRMAEATITEEVTIRGGSALGRISRKMMRACPKPRLRAAMTKSFSRRARNSARESRATVGQDTMAMPMVMVHTVGWAMATSTTSSTKLGSVWKISITRTSRSSTQPPK